MEYRSEIDGLRAIAVIPVILFHAGVQTFSGGFIGVDIFFVISGYLITTIILSEMERGTFSLVNFYERRARRILPALFLVMLISLPFAWLFLMPSDMRDFLRSLVAVSFFSSNIHFWLESGYWDTASELKPLLHTWSLAVEEQYYVFFPLFLMAMWRYRKRWILGSFTLIAGLSLALAQWGAYHNPSSTFYLLPTRGWELAIGAGIAFYFLYRKQAIRTLCSDKLIDETLGLLGFLMIGYSIFMFDERTPFPSVYTLLPTVGTGLIILFSSSKTIAGRLLSAKPLVVVGLISYSAYLWHQPLFAFSRHISGNVYTALIFFTFPLAYISYKYVETPFRNQNLVNRKSIFASSITGAILFILVGTFGSFFPAKLSYIASNELYLEREKLIYSIKKERQVLIGAGVCHYNNRGTYTKIDEFIDNWSCLSNDEAGMIHTKAAVFGDSHSADKAAMFKLNGVDVAQLGGAGCPLLPSSNADCNKLLVFFHHVTHREKISTVIIANRFSLDELSPEYLQNIFDYWGSKYEKVILFSPMIEFGSWDRRYLRNGVFEFHPNYDFHRLFFENISNLTIPEGFKIINTGKLLCGEEVICSDMMANGELLLTDYGHLSKAGAKKLGNKLMTANDNLLSSDLRVSINPYASHVVD